MNAGGLVENGGGGPCGACKFLRRKCVKGCIFAPYFDSDQGTSHFAAVHRVFGASNASKLLLRIPPHRRLEAVVTLCYEAVARVRDPVYGCVAHIFTLQQQVLNLQAELAYTQARISTLKLGPGAGALPPQPPTLISSSEFASSQTNLYEETLPDVLMFSDHSPEDGDLESLAREYVLRYFPGVRFKPPSSQWND